MKKILLILIAVCGMGQANAQSSQTLVDFEKPILPHPQMDYTQTIDTGDYYFNVWELEISQSYYFSQEKIFYGRRNTDSSFSGFTYSNVKDTVGIDSLMRRAAFPGSGHNNSSQYAVAHGAISTVWYATFYSAKPSNGGRTDSIYNLYVTNSTYNVLSMLYGDSTCKKFGGASGTEHDWFLLTITGYRYNQMIDTVLFYLADFRSDTPGQDYIVKDWRSVDLGKFGSIDSLTFSLSSSDTDSNGLMRTPAYFCLDDIKSEIIFGGVSEIYQNELFKVYPNPIAPEERLFIESKLSLSAKQYSVSIYNLSGEEVLRQQVKPSQSLVLPHLLSGVYTLKIFVDNERQPQYSQKLLVK